MNCSYTDIRTRIAEFPVWFDENGTPRYCEFSPREIADIYASEVALCEIACQNCGKTFDVAISKGLRGLPDVGKRIADGTLGYRDPPNTGCCASGPTMNSVMLRVMEFWYSRGGDEWKRDASFERTFPQAPEEEF